MKTMLAIIFLVLLAGCSTLNTAGQAHYSVSPFEDKNGGLHCCVVDVVNGKEMAYLAAHISMGKDGTIEVNLVEQGVAAFEGQRIASVVAQDATKAAVTAAMVAGGVLIAPMAVPALGAVVGAGALPAIATGAAGALAVDKATTP